MNVYVAGRFTRKVEVKRAQALLVAYGHTISADWTMDSVDGLMGEERLARLAQSAAKDLGGVRRADAILVLHDDTGRGLFVELGIALADPKKLVCVVGGQRGSHPQGCIFYYLPHCRHFCTLEGAVKFITQAERP
jgi:hypothetical protein